MNTTVRKLDAAQEDLRHVLRAGTSDLHARVDAHFADGLGTPEAYARYLVGMHRFAADFEIVIGALPRASYWLAGDLDDLSLAPLPPAGVRGFASDADERLGWEYVMAGSSLGARHLLRDVQALGHTEQTGARFLARHAGGTEWRNVLDRLTARSAYVDLPYTHLLQGARDAFLLVQVCFQRSFDAVPAPRKEPNQ
ncbi:MAG: biliverdin-producing heme oxygenase [Luteimonas sp.]